MTNLIRSRLSPSFAGPTFGDINSALFFADTQTQHTTSYTALCSSNTLSTSQSCYIWTQDLHQPKLCVLYDGDLIMNDMRSVICDAKKWANPISRNHDFLFVFELAFDGAYRELGVSQAYTQPNAHTPLLIQPWTAQILISLLHC